MLTFENIYSLNPRTPKALYQPYRRYELNRETLLRAIFTIRSKTLITFRKQLCRTTPNYLYLLA